jgi:hypothetical protein
MEGKDESLAITDSSHDFDPHHKDGDLPAVLSEMIVAPQRRVVIGTHHRRDFASESLEPPWGSAHKIQFLQT